MSVPKDLIKDNEGIGKWNIIHGYRGSIAHGMYIPNTDPFSIDDKDTMGICVPPKEYYIGLKEFGSRGTKEIKRGEWDIVIYELKKAIKLLVMGNPNILSILWLSPQYYINITDAGQLLIDNRDLFVGKHVYQSFTGYAHGQLHRMEHYVFEGYMGTKRKQLVDTFGYDTKNASHLIRLLRMGIEFLNDGYLYVERPDAVQLLDIKKGKWSLEQVKEESDRLFKLTDEAYLHSKLPAKLDIEKINKLCINIIEESWKHIP